MNLSVSALFLEISLMLLPGFVWMKIDKAYGVKVESSQFDLILNSFIYSIVSYLVLASIYWALGLRLNILSVDADSKKLLQPDVIPEILMAFIIAIFLSIIWLYIVNKKLVTRFIQFIGASKTYGDEDVWDYIFNSSSPSVRFIHVRDFERHVVYAGDVTVFSETGKLRELLLQDVTVYDFEGTELYSKPSIYMSKPTENMHIEFPTEKEQT